MSKKCSVIIPTKNRRNLIGYTVRNILNQTHKPDEIIVVDDGSEDGTIEFLKHEFTSEVTIVKNAGNGPGAARNTGLQMAQGDYIKFFDSDDLMSLNTIETQLMLLKGSGEDMVYSPYVHATFENGNWIQKDVILQYSPIPRKTTLRDCMAYGFFTVIPSMMFRRDFLDKVGAWREDIVAYEDWDYLWRIGGYIKTPIHTKECMMIYRIHGNQTTLNHTNKNLRNKDRIKCISSLLENPDLSFREKYFLYCELWLQKQNIGVTENIPWKYHLGLLFKRIDGKLERMITGTNWTRRHGPKADYKVFCRYMFS